MTRIYTTSVAAALLAVAKSATWAQPAVSGNRIFVKDVSSLALWTVDE